MPRKYAAPRVTHMVHHADPANLAIAEAKAKIKAIPSRSRSLPSTYQVCMVAVELTKATNGGRTTNEEFADRCRFIADLLVELDGRLGGQEADSVSD